MYSRVASHAAGTVVAAQAHHSAALALVRLVVLAALDVERHHHLLGVARAARPIFHLVVPPVQTGRMRFRDLTGKREQTKTIALIETCRSTGNLPVLPGESDERTFKKNKKNKKKYQMFGKF